MTKIGVDDFLISQGKASLIDRLVRPSWTISNTYDPPGTMEPTEERIKLLFRPLVLKSEIDMEAIFINVKLRTKLPIAVLKKTFKAVQREWKSLGPKDADAEGTLIWDYERDTHSWFFKRVGGLIEKIPNAYLEQKSDGLILIKNPPDGYDRIISGRELSKVLLGKIHFKQGRRGKDGIFVTDHGFQAMPSDALDAFLSDVQKYAHLKKLAVFSRTPLVIDNQLINTPGFHSLVGVFYGGPEIKPKANFDRLKQLLDTFPFADQASWANALGSIITSVVFRQELAGEMPMILANGNEPNLGKTTFIEVLVWIAFATPARSVSFTTDDDEFEKRLATEVRYSDHVLIDNVKSRGTIASQTLERSLTSPVLNFRLLGANESITRINNIVMAMTVNDAQLGRDLLERGCPIFFTSDFIHRMARGFDPQIFVKTHREEILSEIVGMVVRWINQGCPLQLPQSFRVPQKYWWASSETGNLPSL